MWEMSSHATRQWTIIQSSQLAEPVWKDPGLKSEIGARKLTFALKKQQQQKSAGGDWYVVQVSCQLQSPV